MAGVPVAGAHLTAESEVSSDDALILTRER